MCHDRDHVTGAARDSVSSGSKALALCGIDPGDRMLDTVGVVRPLKAALSIPFHLSILGLPLSLYICTAG